MPSKEPEALKVVSLANEAAAVTDSYRNWVVAVVNDHCVRLSVMTGEYPWHQHPTSDECFLTIEGTLNIDLADGRRVNLQPGEMFTVPAGVWHRTRTVGRSVNLTFEHVNASADTVFDDTPGS